MDGWCHAAKRESTAPCCCSGLWSVWGQVCMQPAVSYVVLLASRTLPYTNCSLTSFSYLQKCSRQVLDKTHRRGQTTQRKQSRRVKTAGREVWWACKALCPLPQSVCSAYEELSSGQLVEGVRGSVLILGAWVCMKRALPDVLPSLLWSSDWGGLLARAWLIKQTMAKSCVRVDLGPHQVTRCRYTLSLRLVHSLCMGCSLQWRRGGALGIACSFPSWCFPGDGTFLCCPLCDFCELEMTYATAVCLPKSVYSDF